MQGLVPHVPRTCLSGLNCVGMPRHTLLFSFEVCRHVSAHFFVGLLFSFEVCRHVSAHFFVGLLFSFKVCRHVPACAGMCRHVSAHFFYSIFSLLEGVPACVGVCVRVACNEFRLNCVGMPRHTHLFSFKVCRRVSAHCFTTSSLHRSTSLFGNASFSGTRMQSTSASHCRWKDSDVRAGILQSMPEAERKRRKYA